jgi:predicted outer membrane protein
MRRHNRLAVTAGLAVLTLASCASEPPRRAAPAPRPPVVIRGIPVPPATYVRTAASIDLYAIKASQIALTRARDSSLRDLARTEIGAHEGLGSQLSFAGRRLNLLPSAELQPEHQRMVETLEFTNEFDATYRRQQIQVHEAALKLHSDFAASGESATLRPVARNAIPIIRTHLTRLREL